MRARNETQQSSCYCLCTFSSCASPLIPLGTPVHIFQLFRLYSLRQLPKLSSTKNGQKKPTVFCPLHFISCMFLGSSCKCQSAQLARAIFFARCKSIAAPLKHRAYFFLASI